MNKYIGPSEQLVYDLDNRPKRRIHFYEEIETGEKSSEIVLRYDEEEQKKDWAEIEKIVVKFEHRKDSLCQQQQK